MKFRVWDNKENKYVDLKLNNYLIREDGVLWKYNGQDLFYCDPDRYVVEMSTGLKDKNGKEYYAGDKCVAGCKCFTGGEVHHHKDCPQYPESMSRVYDEMEAKIKELEKPKRQPLADGTLPLTESELEEFSIIVKNKGVFKVWLEENDVVYYFFKTGVVKVNGNAVHVKAFSTLRNGLT